MSCWRLVTSRLVASRRVTTQPGRGKQSQYAVRASTTHSFHASGPVVKTMRRQAVCPRYSAPIRPWPLAAYLDGSPPGVPACSLDTKPPALRQAASSSSTPLPSSVFFFFFFPSLFYFVSFCFRLVFVTCLSLRVLLCVSKTHLAVHRRGIVEMLCIFFLKSVWNALHCTAFALREKSEEEEGKK